MARFPLDNHLSLMPQQVLVLINHLKDLYLQMNFIFQREHSIRTSQSPAVTMSASRNKPLYIFICMRCSFRFGYIVKMTADTICFVFNGFSKTILVKNFHPHISVCFFRQFEIRYTGGNRRVGVEKRVCAGLKYRSF